MIRGEKSGGEGRVVSAASRRFDGH
uniref:Uncharacterized protein n=1 Tax=Arundo donax TaxID=35708 RepID=A0A0A9GDV6_ARUDO